MKCFMFNCKEPVFGQLRIKLLHVDSGRNSKRIVKFCKDHFMKVLENPRCFRYHQKKNSPVKAVFLTAEPI
jgi:hypothetical protein